MQVFFLFILLSCLVCIFHGASCPNYLRSRCSDCRYVNNGNDRGNGETLCLACQSGYILYYSYCFEDCVAGKFFYSYKCYACDAPCATCSQSGRCLTCNTGNPLAYSNYCYSTCPTATFQSTTTTCQSCPTFCSSCTGDSYCTGCQAGRYMYQNLCYAQCPPGTYGDSSLHCQPCLSPCATCTSNTICQSCDPGYFLYNSQCLASCPIGTYPSSTICEKCPVGCSACTSATSCTTCASKFYSSGTLCYATCPKGTYGGSNYKCLSCGDGCESCTDISKCLQCASTHNFFDYKCYTTCPPGSFLFMTGGCANCIPGCATCSESKKCDTCTSAFDMYPGGICSKATGSESDPTDGCFSTVPHCAACLNRANCAYCDSNYYLDGNTCKSPCPTGKFARDYACYDCLPNCDQCSGWTTCATCSSGHYLFESNQCLSACPFGYYPLGGQCLACLTNCASCTGASVCTLCNGNYLLNEGLCVATCPTKTYNVNGVCTKCSDHCITCGDGAICTACETGWNLFDNICSDKCPPGFYKDNGACHACPAGCTTCTDLSTCGTCATGYVFYQNSCLMKCPDGMYNATGFCQSCETGCRICENERVCLQCAVEYVYFNKTCLTTCPVGYYDLDAICTVCPIGCTKCTNASFCQSCAWGYNIHMTDVCALDITEEEIAAVKGMAATTEATGTASNVLSSIYGFMNSGDPTAMFMGSLAKMLQYVKYINIEYPPKIKLMFGLQSNLNDTSETIITKTQKKIEDTSKSSTLANNFGYYKLTSSFMSNCFQSLGILAGIIAGIGVNYLLLYLISPSSKIHQICKSLMGILKWNLFLLMFCGMIGDLIFFSSFEFRKANFENAFSVVSFVVCIVMNFLSLFVFYKLVQVNMNLQKSRNSRVARRHEADFLKDAESKWGSCKVFFNSYKNKKLSQQAFMIFFLIRVLSFYLIIAYFTAYPLFQIIAITIVSLLIVMYLVIIRPFKSILNNINQIIFELIIFAFNGCVLILAELETSNSDNYLLRKKLETIMLNINLVAGFVSTAFVLLKAIVVLRDIYKDWKLQKEAKNPLRFRKNRLANIKAKKRNKNLTTNPDTLFAHSDLSSQNIINLDTMTITNMDQNYDNQSFDIQNHNNKNSLLTSHTPSSVSQGNNKRGLGYQEDQEYNGNQGGQGMRLADFQAINQRQRIKKSSTSNSTLSSKRIQKRTAHFTNVAKQILQDGQVWENEEKTLDMGNQTREYDPNKARIRRIQKQNKLNGVDIIGL